MAESVDALVSNTSGATRAGSTPALGTVENANIVYITLLAFFFFQNSPLFPHRRKKYSSKSLFSLATQYKYTTFEKK